jgi:hypothetical protein
MSPPPAPAGRQSRLPHQPAAEPASRTIRPPCLFELLGAVHMAGKTELAREIERQGREGGPEEGWPEMEGTGDGQRSHLRRRRVVSASPPLFYSRAVQNSRRADFHTIRRCQARKLERGRAALPNSAWNLGRFPNKNSVAIQTGELNLTDFQFGIPCLNLDIQTEPKNAIYFTKAQQNLLTDLCSWQWQQIIKKRWQRNNFYVFDFDRVHMFQFPREVITLAAPTPLLWDICVENDRILF